MKAIISLFFAVIALNCFAQQWQTNGANIYNTNSGYVGIGTNSPLKLLHLSGSSDTDIRLQATGTNNVSLQFYNGSSQLGAVGWNAGRQVLKLNASADLNDDHLSIDPSGRVLFGTSTARTDFSSWGMTPSFQIEGGAIGRYTMSIVANSNSINPGILQLGKTRGTSNGSVTAVQENDWLGQVRFFGADGTKLKDSGVIGYQVDGALGDGIPSRFVMHLSSSTGSVKEVLRVKSNGNMGLGGAPYEASKLRIVATSAEGDANTFIEPNGTSVAGVFGRFQASDDNVSGGAYYTYLANGAYHTNNGDANTFTVQNQYVDGQILTVSATSGFRFLSANAATASQSMVANELMRLTIAGNLGIGTPAPSTKLHVYSAGGGTNRVLIENASSDQASVDLKNSASFVRLITDSNHPLRVYDQVAGANRLAVSPTGNVGIGTTTPDAKLTVKGTIHAEEVKVDLNVPGPDYVFEENYPLRSLDETKAYVAQHKHLPGIPSSAEMQQNGVNLLEMNMMLLQKVEELTLHVISQNERIFLLESSNAELKDLRKQIENLSQASH